MTQDYIQLTPSSAEAQQTAEPTSLASPPHSQHGTAHCAPDISPTTFCNAENSQRESMDCKGGVPEQEVRNSPTVILVMGVAHCGKSSFIDKAIGHRCDTVKANIQHYGKAVNTFRIDSFSAELDGKQYLLLDTTGSSRAEDNDPPTIMSLCQQLCNLPDVNGIVYIQRISDSRINRQQRQYLELFEAICGKSCMKNVRLLTNHWDLVDPEEGEDKEKQLLDDWWKGMIDAGATVERLNLTMPECMQSIVKRFSSCPPAVLAIKDEMVHQKIPFVDTTIGHLILDRIEKEQAALCPELEYIDDLKTPEELRSEVYKLKLEVIRVEKEYAKVLVELQHYKKMQSTSMWQSFGFGSCIVT